MWRVYGQLQYGFAIVTTVHDLIGSLTQTLDQSKLGCGFVVYPTRDQRLREAQHYEQTYGSFAAFMIKSPEFAPENEFRVFVKRHAPSREL